MDPSLEALLQGGFLLDALGIIGIGLVALAAGKLSLRFQSWGGHMMAAGAIALLVARLFLIVSPHFLSHDVLHAIGPLGIAVTLALPPILLTFGMAGVVWGLWGHERWLNEDG